MKGKWYESARLIDVCIDDEPEKIPEVQVVPDEEPGELLLKAEVPLETSRLGFGCNTFSGDIRSRALVDDDPFIEPGTVLGQEKEFSLDLIKSKHELNEKMEVGASASYSGLFSVSAKSKFVKEQKLNRESVHLLVKLLVTNSRKQFREYRPAEQFTEFLAAKPVDWNIFIRKYGDQFIEQVVTGGEFYALYEFHAESTEQRNALEVQLEGGGWGFKAAGEFKKALDKIDTEMNVTCRLYIRGGRKRLPDIKEDKVIDAALDFPVDVDPETGAPVVYKAVTKDYLVVDGFPGFPREVQEKLDRSGDFCRSIKQRLAFSEDLGKTLSAQEDLDPVTAKKLEGIRERLTARLSEIALDPLKAHDDPGPLFDLLDGISAEKLWLKVPGPALARVAVGSYRHVWGITPDDRVLQWDGSANNWKTIPGSLCDISVGADGTFWGVNRKDCIFRWDVTRWGDIGGRLRRISVGNVNHVWGINRDGHVFQWVGGHWVDRTTASIRHAACLAAGSDGTVVLLKDGRVFRWNKDSASFETFPGEMSEVAVGDARQIWGVDTNSRVVQWDGEGWKPLPGTLGLKSVSAGADGTLWGVDGAGNIYRLNRTLLPGSV